MLGSPLVGSNDNFPSFIAERTDDERGSRFVDENTVRLVHQNEVHATLNWLLSGGGPSFTRSSTEKIVDRSALCSHQQSVPQKIEPKLFRRPVCDIGTVGSATFVLVMIRQDDPDG